MNDLQIFRGAVRLGRRAERGRQLAEAVPDPAGDRRLLGLIPDIHLNPDLVLLVFLPPLLYQSAFFADLRHCATTRG